MSWIDRLERRWASRLPQNLTWLLLGSWIAVFILHFSRPEMISGMGLNWKEVAEGEWWRMFSFAFIPPVMHPLFFLIAVMFTYFVCSNLERHWGSLRTIFFAGLAWLGILLASFVHTAVTHVPLWGGGGFEQLLFLKLALFAFGTISPNIEILLFFILPVKIKWLAIASAVLIILIMPVGYEFLRIPLVLLIGLPYFVFFGQFWWQRFRRQQRQVAVAREEKRAEAKVFHHCHVCGITDKEAPDRQFRVDIVDGEAKDICEVCLAERKQPDVASLKAP